GGVIASLVLAVDEREDASRAADLSGLAAIFASAPVAIYEFTLDGIVVRWNPAAAATFGWDEAEVVGRRLPIVGPEHEAEFAEVRRRVGGGESLDGVRMQRRRRDGTLVDLAVSNSPVRDATGEVVSIMALAQDISEQIAFEADLLATARGLSELFNSSP